MCLSHFFDIFELFQRGRFQADGVFKGFLLSLTGGCIHLSTKLFNVFLDASLGLGRVFIFSSNLEVTNQLGQVTNLWCGHVASTARRYDGDPESRRCRPRPGSEDGTRKT